MLKDPFINFRNLLSRNIYRFILKPFFFIQDPEEVHDKAIRLGSFLGSNIITKSLIKFFFSYKNNILTQRIAGITFPNPIGLAAGFDKDAKITNILPSVGFGFMEVGSITGEPCQGNPKPRLWRLKKSNSLLVYYGLKNDGSEIISKRLQKKKFQIPLGVSIAKTNNKETTNTEKGIKDYLKAYNNLKNIGSYHVLNISCPNTFGGLPFTSPQKLEKLLKKIKIKKPLFLKLSPDLTKKDIDKIILTSKKYKVTGFICTNLSKKRTIKNLPGQGSISGKPVEKLSNEIIKYIYKKTKGKFIIIGCGGVFTAQDAYKKIKLGASLIQLITGMIYQGPQLISEINQDLTTLLKKDGFKNISEAIGKDNS